jgi:hypothetical protein
MSEYMQAVLLSNLSMALTTIVSSIALVNLRGLPGGRGPWRRSESHHP